MTKPLWENLGGLLILKSGNPLIGFWNAFVLQIVFYSLIGVVVSVFFH